MFSCRACLRRAVQLQLQSFPVQARTIPDPFLVRLANAQLLRSAVPAGPSSVRAISQKTARASRFVTRERDEKQPDEEKEEDEGIDQDQNVSEDQKQKQQQKLRQAVRKHLEYMNNSYTIAKHVERTLRKSPERFDETLLLVQTASKNHGCTVAWNHLIDFQLRAHRVRPAIRLLNDMKKRAQRPDAHTYTVLFRGLAQSANHDLAVAEAVRLFHAMRREPNLSPNIIHLNAVLNVCARAGDLDAMFGLIDDALLDGQDAAAAAANKAKRGDKLVPTSQTYTAILQGLRASAASPADKDKEAIVGEEGEEGEEGERRERVERRERGERGERAERGEARAETKERIAEVIQHCRAVWEEVLGTWRKGNLVLDDQLVGAMGRALLLDKKAGPRDILALLEQAMGVPRFDIPGNKPVPASPVPQAPEQEHGSSGSSATPSKQRRKKAPAAPELAKPGLNTFSLLLTALSEARLVSASVKYWNYLVKERGVEPDTALWEQMIRVLYLGRSSAEVARVLAAAPPAVHTPYLFRTAMSTCFRDMRNANVVDNASSIVDAMVLGADGAGRAPDARTLWMYLQVPQRRAGVEASLAGNGKDKNKDKEDVKLDPSQLVPIVDRAWEPFCRAAEGTWFAEVTKSRHPKMIRTAKTYEAVCEVFELARELLSLAAHIARAGGDKVDAKTKKAMVDRRDDLNRQVVVFTELKGELDARFGRKEREREREREEVPSRA